MAKSKPKTDTRFNHAINLLQLVIDEEKIKDDNAVTIISEWDIPGFKYSLTLMKTKTT